MPQGSPAQSALKTLQKKQRRNTATCFSLRSGFLLSSSPGAAVHNQPQRAWSWKQLEAGGVLGMCTWACPLPPLVFLSYLYSEYHKCLVFPALFVHGASCVPSCVRQPAPPVESPGAPAGAGGALGWQVALGMRCGGGGRKSRACHGDERRRGEALITEWGCWRRLRRQKQRQEC